MKISSRWLRQLLPFEVSTEEAAKVLTATGLEVEGIEHVNDLPGGLEGIVVGHVTSVEPHANADRLKVCHVDIASEEGLLQIVCGASNVSKGQKVPVATVGCTLHPHEGEPFKIKKGKIRGEVSMGMICAEDEIGLGAGHEGIMVLDEAAAPGMPLAQHLGLSGDEVIEIGLTPNRNDAMGHWGVARDLRAGLMHGTVEGIGPMELGALSLPETTPLDHALSCDPLVSLNIDASEDCPHYFAVVFEGVAVAESPEWAKKQLRAIGIQPINNVVDATNLVMHEFGNPLHAFDLDQIQGASVVVRRAKENESFRTLDGVDRSLDSRDLVIADQSQPMCLAGVYGGETSGVSNSTTRVLLEAAWFHPVTVRKTAKRHGLSTDASFRFERGVDPNTVRLAAERCAHLLQAWTGATIAGAQEHQSDPLATDHDVSLSLGWLKRFLGTDLPPEKIQSILTSLDIDIMDQTTDAWSLRVPAYRSDVTRPADVAEEILRIHGFDHIPLPERMTGTLEVPTKPNREDVLFGWREMLVNLGFTEIMSNSLTKASYADLIQDRALQPEKSVHVLNPLSSDLGAMRQSLLFQGLEAIALNTNHQQPDLRLFEFGRTYLQEAQDDGLTYTEHEHLSMWVTGRAFPETWNRPKGKEALSDLFTLKQAVQALLSKVGIEVTEEVEDGKGLLAEGVVLRARNGAEVGRWGLVQPSVASSCGVTAPVFWADFEVKALWKAVKKHKLKAHDLPKFPSVRRDLALVVSRDVAYERLKQAALSADKKWLKEVELFDVYEGKGLGENERSYALSFKLQHPEATLTDTQIESTMEKILKALESEGAKLR